LKRRWRYNPGVPKVERPQTESELRLATELDALKRAVLDLRDLLRERLHDRRRIDDHERRIQVLERAGRRR